MTAFLLAQTAGLPNWGWAIILLLAVTEMVLGRCEDPRFRSTADTLRHGLGVALALTPVGGPWLIRFLKVVYIVPKSIGIPDRKKQESP